MTSPIAFVRRALQPRPDPATGDLLPFGERVSWGIQGLIRCWPVVIGHVVLSVVWWTHPGWFGDTPDLPHWMAVYSLLAVVIESIVGLAMFSQTRRDATALREVRAISRRLEQMAAVILADVEQVEAEIEDRAQ
jgi:hypothetical protein